MRNRVLFCAALAILSGLPARQAAAASLQQVTSWGASGVPSYVAMYIYVPNTLAAHPPILVVSHYCGGDAAGVYGEAQSGGIVAAADKYGFIMIFPQNHQPGTTRNCWDVGSTASLTHDGGGDTQAIAQMVKYALGKYNANPDRVYAVGTSSGAMMTQALLAVYPDVFKAGSEFAGVPAGCWAVGYSASNQWSGSCAGGQVTHTAQEWGDLARNMDKGYTGRRPRVQLWHGLADPTISPTNHTEAIKQWTNVLGLPSSPTTTMTVSLSNHQWTRQTWTDACGAAILDAWGEANGPHGTDANLNAQYVIPFLALDKTGDVDPVIAGCAGDGGVGGSGGVAGSGGGAAGTDGGVTGAGGRGGGVAGNRDAGADGAAGAAGSAAGGGTSGGAGGQAGAGEGRGGAAGALTASGGRGGDGAGGSASPIDAGTAGGSQAGSGAGGSSAGGSSAGGSGGPGDTESGGCSCGLGGDVSRPGRDGAFLIALATIAFARRRRRRA